MKRVSEFKFTEEQLNETIEKVSKGGKKEEVDVGLWENMIFYKSISNVKAQRVKINNKMKPEVLN